MPGQTATSQGLWSRKVSGMSAASLVRRTCLQRINGPSLARPVNKRASPMPKLSDSEQPCHTAQRAFFEHFRDAGLVIGNQKLHKIGAAAGQEHALEVRALTERLDRVVMI